MILKFIKLICKALDISVMLQDVAQFFNQEIKCIKQEITKQISHLFLKAILWILIIFFILLMCVFLLVALAVYMNDLFYSSYKGFLFVSIGCLLLSLLLILVSKVNTKQQTRHKQK